MSKKAHVSDGTFAELMKSAEQALAYERGEGTDCRVTQVSSERIRTVSRTVTSSVSLLKREHKKLSNK